MQFDLMCIGPNPFVEFDISNSNPTLRTVTVATNVEVYRMGDDGVHWDLLSYDDWLTTPSSPFCGYGQCAVWLYVNDGRVTEIVELWFA